MGGEVYAIRCARFSGASSIFLPRGFRKRDRMGRAIGVDLWAVASAASRSPPASASARPIAVLHMNRVERN